MERIAMSNTEDHLPNEREIRIERTMSEKVKTHFATNFAVQRTEEYFIITFYELFPPLIVGTDEERRAQLSELETIESKALTRVVVTPAHFRELMGHMESQLEKYERQMGINDESDD